MINRESLLNEGRVSVWCDEKVLETVVMVVHHCEYTNASEKMLKWEVLCLCLSLKKQNCGK